MAAKMETSEISFAAWHLGYPHQVPYLLGRPGWRYRRHVAALHPFRFGLSLMGFDHGHDWSETARKIEDLGYSTLLVPDHFADQLAPFPALMAAAGATSTLRVGTYMCAVDFRHPAMLAKEAATIDLLSSGRFELGIGAGWRKSEYDDAGIEFASGAQRIDRLEEAVAVIRAMWDGKPFSFHGNHYVIDNMQGRPLPFNQISPPILIGGAGEKILSLAGRTADIISIAPRTFVTGTRDESDISESSFINKLDVIRASAGSRYDQIELNASVLSVNVTNDRMGAAEALAVRYGLTPDEVITSPHLLVGDVDQVVDCLVERRERFGLSYVVVSEPSLDQLGPVVARLSGK